MHTILFMDGIEIQHNSMSELIWLWHKYLEANKMNMYMCPLRSVLWTYYGVVGLSVGIRTCTVLYNMRYEVYIRHESSPRNGKVRKQQNIKQLLYVAAIL